MATVHHIVLDLGFSLRDRALIRWDLRRSGPTPYSHGKPATKKDVIRWVKRLVRQALADGWSDAWRAEGGYKPRRNPRKIVVPLGKLVAVTYERGDTTYRHEFEEAARPVIGADATDRLTVMGGAYTVDPDRGLVDLESASV